MHFIHKRESSSWGYQNIYLIWKNIKIEKKESWLYDQNSEQITLIDVQLTKQIFEIPADQK